MMIPGSNVLNMALQLIAKQPVCYIAFVSRKTLENGMLVSKYASPVTVMGSVQPVPRTVYAMNGLDLQKNYFNVFLPQKIVDINRDVSGDQFSYNGLKLQGISAMAWSSVDGWTEILCVALNAR